MRTLTVLLVVLGIWPRVASAQTTARMDIVVTDSSGVPVKDLTEDSFTVIEGGETRAIRSFSPPDTPWNVILLLDHSLTWLQSDDGRSSSANYVVNSWRVLADSMSRFLAQLGPRDRVAIAAFEDKVEVLLDWRIALTGKQQDIQLPVIKAPQGQKNMYGAIEWAVAKLRGVQGRKAVILFTDGRDGRLSPQWLMSEGKEEIFDPLFGMVDSGEANEFLKTSEAVRASGARFFFLAVNTNRPPDFRGRPISGLFPGAKEAIAGYAARVRLRMERFAQFSAGGVMYGSRPEDAIRAFATLYDDLMLGARYTLEYSSTRQPDDPETAMEVQVKGEKLRVRYLRFR